MCINFYFILFIYFINGLFVSAKGYENDYLISCAHSDGNASLLISSINIMSCLFILFFNIIT